MARPDRVSSLGEAMNRRRVDLDMTWRDVERAAGLSYEGLRGIRRGDRNPSALTARHLDDALQWRHGSVEAVLDGGEPEVVDAADDSAASGEKDWPTLRAELMQLVEQVDAIIEQERRKRGA